MIGNSKRKTKKFQKLLLGWWAQHKADFPWRHTTNPYKILIAEILLRKTTRNQAASVYESFLRAWPSPELLAEGPEERIKELIRPLGMENVRASLLVRLGQELQDKFGGEVPASLSSLMKLPGVGRYAANAVLCFAYHQDQPLVDTNTARVIQRVFGYSSPKARAREDKLLWQIALNLLPKGFARDFNFALIDLAGNICLPSTPASSKCPLNGICLYASKTKNG